MPRFKIWNDTTSEWEYVSGTGNVNGATSSVNGGVTVFSGTSGKSITDSTKLLPAGDILGTDSIDTDSTLAANSDTKVASQKAVKSYVTTGLAAKQNSLGYTAENIANKSTDASMVANSDTYYPTQKAVKTHVSTNYLNKLGVSGGQTTVGGTSSSEDLTLKANSAAWSSTNTGAIKLTNSLIKFIGQNVIANSTFTSLVSFTEVVDASGFSTGSLNGFNFAPTIQQDTSLAFAAFPAFSASPILQPTAGGISDGPYAVVTSFFANTNHSLAHSGAAGSTTNMYGYVDQPNFKVSSGTGTHTVSNYAAFASFEPILFGNHFFTGYTITNARTLYARNPGVSGATLTNNIGVDIDKLTAGSTNIGIRNKSTTVNTPDTVQSITSASQAITVASTTKQLTSNSNYTLTAAPTIANGQDGQVITIINVGANTITLQDQGTLASSNLRLSATTVALSPRSSIQLMYSSTISDWVQIGQTNVL